jgi:hypothetical protein
MKIRAISFFDYVDYDGDVEDLKMSLFAVEQDLGIKIEYIPTDNEDSFGEKCAPGVLAFIDYGALNYGGTTGLKDHYDRFMTKTIENHTATEFIFILTMGKDAYADELFELPNVHSIARGYSCKELATLIKSLT